MLPRVWIQVEYSLSVPPAVRFDVVLDTTPSTVDHCLVRTVNFSPINYANGVRGTSRFWMVAVRMCLLLLAHLFVFSVLETLTNASSPSFSSHLRRDTQFQENLGEFSSHWH